MLDAYPREFNVDRGLLVRCIEACYDCAESCTQCADDCLGEGSVQELTTCIRLNLDCADICATTGRVVSRQTGYDAELTSAVLRECIEACRSCADECEIHAAHGMEHCKVCAEECSRCEQGAKGCSPRSPEPGACDTVSRADHGPRTATFGLGSRFSSSSWRCTAPPTGSSRPG